MNEITVVGGGLAGCEAALAAARLGAAVRLIEMKPEHYSPAHTSPNLCELVCSNSLKAVREDSAAGTLKAEMRLMGSVVTGAADMSRVEAGGALAVDRELFSRLVTEKVTSHPLITVERRRADAIPPEGVCVIAAGPLCSGALAADIGRVCGRMPAFFDAVSPIVSAAGVDTGKVFTASRYGKGGGGYVNCPMDRDRYELFRRELAGAQTVPLPEFDLRGRFYEGCMPIEALAARGEDAMRFGPLKPVGLRDPATGRRPWAVVQLRPENREADMYNLVGFQTNLRYGEQKRVFSLIPGLENAEFLRYGKMHRNTFIDSPGLLAPDMSLRSDPRIFFAGQITGVEGYCESAASGLAAGINAARRARGLPPAVPPATTVTGALLAYVSGYCGRDFQPMGANLGILAPLETPIFDKRRRREACCSRARADAGRYAEAVFGEKKT